MGDKHRQQQRLRVLEFGVTHLRPTGIQGRRSELLRGHRHRRSGERLGCKSRRKQRDGALQLGSRAVFRCDGFEAPGDRDGRHRECVDCECCGWNLMEVSSAGDVLSGPSGYSGGDLSYPTGVVFDGAGNVWVANYGGAVKFSPNGTALFGTHGSAPFCNNVSTTSIAADGSGDIWTLTFDDDVCEFIGLSVPVITPIAAGLPVTPTTDGSSNLGTRP